MIEKILEALDKVDITEKKGPNIEKNLDEKQTFNLNYDPIYKENPKEINTRNKSLEGKNHPETDIPFERKEIETPDGKKEGVFAQFEAVADLKLPEQLEQGSDREQFKYCNDQLKDLVEANKETKDLFTEEQIEQILDGETPDGYTWHHSEDKGIMQLVDSEIHAKTGHTGGKSIWGGGSENR